MRDEPLTGGRMTAGIVRRGDRLLRPMGPWSPAVHELLRYLETAGFDAAPRVLGTDGDREILTYLPGEVANDPDWQPGRGHRLPPYARTDGSLAAAARLVRRLHAAAAGFAPRHTRYRLHPHPPQPGELVSHGDLGPWNTVYRDGVPSAFIDWDGARPLDPLTDLAEAAWAFVPLAPPEQLREAGFDPVPDLPARLRLFTDAYGLPDRAAILPALVRARLPAPEQASLQCADAASAADVLAHAAGELRWLDAILPDLAGAL
jgi:aminoglycoside phosphotransferase (APT) family kinase protein